MRYIYQGTFRAYNELLSDATVTVYLTGTTTLATIYTVSSGGTADADSAVTTDSAGGFSFYVDEADYMPDQLFDITLSKTGYTEKTYSKVSIFPSKTPNIATTAVSYAMLLSDDVINCTATATITPLTASTCTGKEVEIRNSGSGTVTITGSISGVTNPTLAQYECLTIRSDGTVWYEVRPKYSVVSTTTTDATNVTTSINSHAITDIFESNGTTVKNATAATSATSATTATNASQIKVSSNDTTYGYLNGKLAAGNGISLTEGSDGGNETLTPAIYIASQAQGDILYYNGSAWARLGYGTSGYFLKTQGTGANPTWAATTKISGDIVQVVNQQYITYTTSATTTPMDDTIPQNTEGAEIMSLSITPTSATNNLLIVVVTHLSNVTAGAWIISALHQDTTADALATGLGYINGANQWVNTTFTHLMAAGTTSATAFKVRVGSHAGTTAVNGTGTRLLGGVMPCSITIFEIQA